MSTDTHPDDDTDDIETLRDNLRYLRKRLAEQEAAREAADALVTEMREEIERQGELRERWIEVFDMQMSPETGAWMFDSEQSDLWERHARLHEEHRELVKRWNANVTRFNAVFADQRERRGKGRPRAASDAQEAEVLRMRKAGRSYADTVAATGLSAKTVRTIATAPARAVSARQTLKRQILNREAAARYRARLRGRALIEKEVNDAARRQAKLIRAAKGLDR